ncbi:MAG: FKBP-type peptidyl-prolyl cis-trans isomerase [Verrucomicrobia bacterium]|nr:FKBP-type peptidyl-prolyl cis-trans isomerase [Verrucomicrobiota bacterium]MDE3100509.1 FKBP-type peptidyl-prolyl cis-trans isomerase [Verrucomicrobiota bacterium]
MKIPIRLFAVALIAIAPALARADAAAQAQNTNLISGATGRASYALGMLYGHFFQQQGVKLDYRSFVQGIKDEEAGKPALTSAEMNQTLADYRKQIAAEQAKRQAQIALENKIQGAKFLAENKKKPDVHTLPDGLEYKIITDGKGPRPASNDVVTVNYRGTLINGSEFDSTARRGEPAQFPLNDVIRGWTEALERMPVGSLWKIYIPSDLAYGAAGRPPQIPANSTLIFTVQLISATPPGARPPAPPPMRPLTSDIIAVPSAKELKQGKKPYMLTPQQVQQMRQQLQHTNT